MKVPKVSAPLAAEPALATLHICNVGIAELAASVRQFRSFMSMT
jgi:hypothetical protein